MKVCNVCGAPLAEDQEFCGQCGERVVFDEGNEQLNNTTVTNEPDFSNGQIPQPVFEASGGSNITPKKKESNKPLIAIIIVLVILIGSGVTYFAFLLPKQSTLESKCDDIKGYIEDGMKLNVDNNLIYDEIKKDKNSLSIFRINEANEEADELISMLEKYGDIKDTVDGYKAQVDELTKKAQNNNVYSGNVISKHSSFKTDVDSVEDGMRENEDSDLLKDEAKDLEDAYKGYEKAINDAIAAKSRQLTPPAKKPKVKKKKDYKKADISDVYVADDSTIKKITSKNDPIKKVKKLKAKDRYRLYILAKNEIYARYGYIFTKSDSMNEYFNNRDWYDEDLDAGDNEEMTEYITEYYPKEKANIEYFQSKIDYYKNKYSWAKGLGDDFKTKEYETSVKKYVTYK